MVVPLSAPLDPELGGPSEDGQVDPSTSKMPFDNADPSLTSVHGGGAGRLSALYASNFTSIAEVIEDRGIGFQKPELNDALYLNHKGYQEPPEDLEKYVNLKALHLECNGITHIKFKLVFTHCTFLDSDRLKKTSDH